MSRILGVSPETMVCECGQEATPTLLGTGRIWAGGAAEGRDPSNEGIVLPVAGGMTAYILQGFM